MQQIPKSASANEGPPSLLGTTIRRTLSLGRLYLGIAVGLSLLLGSVLVFGGGRSAAFSSAYPLEVPLFSILGGTGGILTFTSDRTKGVFEYLLAYGVKPRSLFLNGLAASATMSGIILGSSTRSASASPERGASRSCRSSGRRPPTTRSRWDWPARCSSPRSG